MPSLLSWALHLVHGAEVTLVCLLKTEVKIESEAKFLGLIRTKKFILNEPFTMRFRFRNISERGEIFPGGSITILIDWHGGAPEYVVLKLGKLEDKESTCVKTEPLRVHNVGMGTVMFGGGSPAVLLRLGEREVRAGSPTQQVIDGIPATNWSEVYTLSR